jgi:alpha-tubulin suppressor-like RCC1 family protein
MGIFAKLALCGAAAVVALGLAACQPKPGTTPTPVQVTINNTHGCALMSDRTVKCWGNNRDGQLGNGVATGTNAGGKPVAVTGLTNAKAVAVGTWSTCAILTTGHVSCWGLNSHGELGNGTLTSSSVPVEVPGITDATSIDATDDGWTAVCASLASGGVKCWGDNLYGVLGTTSVPNTKAGIASSPVSVEGITDAASVSVGFGDACVLHKDATVSCWGRNEHGQVGNASVPTGSNALAPTPVTVTGLTGVTSISTGAWHSCAITTIDTRCWGADNAGQLGNGSDLGDTVTPVSVTGGRTFQQLGGTEGSCGRSNGTAYCWGPNLFRQVGNTSVPDSGPIGQPPHVSAPIQVSNVPAGKVTEISAGTDDVCAIADKAVWCWGYDAYGAMGTGSVSATASWPRKVLGV